MESRSVVNWVYLTPAASIMRLEARVEGVEKQIFIDGNKRTSIIFINHYLISKGKGIIVIPAELTGEFKDLLIPYYEGKDDKEIKKFIKEKCYLGI